ncbi:hypothetical protein EP7_005227 [Isosphaeraceae bacterium EP7]
MTRLRRDTLQGMPSVVGRTKTLVAYPTSASRFYALEPLFVLGQETEGGQGSVTAAPATFFAYNLGAGVPASGTTVVATFTGARWVFRYDG